MLTLEQQAGHAYRQLQAEPTRLARHVYLEQLYDRNQTLYFRVLCDHLAELLPVVYVPTVPEVIGRRSHEHRRPRGVFLSIDRPDDIEKSFAAFGLGPDDVDILVCSDGAGIPGIGDAGVGGFRMAAARLAVYVAAAGIHPGRALPVALDVGTDNEALLGDPRYLGNRHARRGGGEYDAFLGRYVGTAARLFPRALLHFQDLGPEHALALTQAYGGYRIFSDDVQGTAAMALAAVYAAIRVTGIPMKHQELLICGAGAAGIGIARLLHAAMVADGADTEQARSQIWLAGRDGLLCDDMDLREYQRAYARRRSGPPRAAGTWPAALAEAIGQAAPTILLGTAAAPGTLTRQAVLAMCRSTARPLILLASGQAAGATPGDIAAWSDGKALVAAVPPAGSAGGTAAAGGLDNTLVVPGLGLGAVVSRASRVTPRMLQAAAAAAADQAGAAPGAPLLPGVRDLRACSALVAEAVARAAVEDKVAAFNPTNLAQAVRDAMWRPVYPEAG